MAIKPEEGTRAPRQMPSSGHEPKGSWVAKAIAGGELLYSSPANPKEVKMEMEWIILLAVILSAYFIYTVLKKHNDVQQKELELKQKQLDQKERELNLNPEYRRQRTEEGWKSIIADARENVVEKRLKLEEAQASGDKASIEYAQSGLAYSQEWLADVKQHEKRSD